MSDPHDDDLTRAQTELGEPEFLFRVGPGRFWAKLGLGVGLLVYGVVANVLWFGQGQFGFGIVEKFILFAPPLFGAALLYHMYRDRGLFVLVYPAGLLRLRRGEVDSFPWPEVEAVKVKARKAEVRFDRGDAGEVTACWLDAELPAVKVWEAGVTLARADGAEAHLGPVLSDFAKLSEEVQRRTFAVLWPAARDRLRAGEEVEFEELAVGPAGLRHDERLLPWGQLKEVVVANSRVTIKQEGRWVVWLAKDVSAVPNPHVLLALIEQARRAARPGRAPHPVRADHAAGR
jgi:hypothetical protein